MYQQNFGSWEMGRLWRRLESSGLQGKSWEQTSMCRSGHWVSCPLSGSPDQHPGVMLSLCSPHAHSSSPQWPASKHGRAAAWPCSWRTRDSEAEAVPGMEKRKNNKNKPCTILRGRGCIASVGSADRSLMLCLLMRTRVAASSHMLNSHLLILCSGLVCTREVLGPGQLYEDAEALS